MIGCTPTGRHDNTVDVDSRLRRLPPIAVFCPIESAVHPQAGELEMASMQWLAGFDHLGGAEYRRRLLATRSAEFAARVAPHGILDRLQIAADWDYWGFAFDDRSDDGALARDLAGFVAYTHRLMRLLETPDPRTRETDPTLAAIVDLSTRFSAQVTHAQHRRWVDAHRSWLFGVTAQIAAAGVPDLDRYLTIRLNNAAGEVVTVMTELVTGYEIPDSEYSHPTIRALSEMARLIAALDNDLHSFAKTVVMGEANRQNIIEVLAAQDGCSSGSAVSRAISLRDRIMCRFLTLSARAGEFSVDTRQYIRDLGHVIRGNIDWALTVPRYIVDGQAVSEFFSVIDTPADGSVQAPGIPCIDWWWQL